MNDYNKKIDKVMIAITTYGWLLLVILILGGAFLFFYGSDNNDCSCFKDDIQNETTEICNTAKYDHSIDGCEYETTIINNTNNEVIKYSHRWEV